MVCEREDDIKICSNHTRHSDNSNPFCLIYHILKYSKEHKSPVQCSALTPWENELPLRIDLSKRNYRGPFTSEEDEGCEDISSALLVVNLFVWDSCCSEPSLMGTPSFRIP